MRRAPVAALAVLALTGACGGDSPDQPVARQSATTTTTATVNTITTTTSVVAPTTTRVSTTTTSSAPRVAEPPQLRGVPGSQAIVVTAGAYGQTTATLTAYERADGGWRVVRGPWSARVGSAGIAPPGAKREGDGRTPSGTYGFEFMFGVDPDPGVRFAFRRVTGPNIVWVDDPSSPRYNQWVDTNEADAGASPEPMYVRPQYDLGAVIAYNTARTPGLGSAIFLHVSAGRATAGCVALPSDQLRSLLTWLEPQKSPVIVIGVG